VLHPVGEVFGDGVSLYVVDVAVTGIGIPPIYSVYTISTPSYFARKCRAGRDEVSRPLGVARPTADARRHRPRHRHRRILSIYTVL
jgi:hypothetical protein